MFSTALYTRSGRRAQEAIIAVRARIRNAFREGARFRRVVQELEQTQWLSAERLQALQRDRTRAILEHAMRHVPYYRGRLVEAQVDTGPDFALDAMQRIPFLDRRLVMRHCTELIAKNVLGLRIPVYTSGSTGTPLVLYQTLDAVVRENAFIWRQLTWAGYRRGERRAWLRGELIVPFDRTRGPYWRFNSTDNMLMCSSYHLSERTAEQYVEALEGFDPVLIQAYPSSIAFLARFLESRERPYRGRSLRAVVTTSETLSDEDRHRIEQQFRCRVFEQYGGGERVALVQTCERGTRHVDADYGLVEFVPLERGLHEIVGTGFNNRLMPLIRYRTGDTVETGAGEPCPCGRALPTVKRIYGRLDEYLKTPDGRRIGRLDHIFKGIKHVVEGQIVQTQLDEVVLRVVPLADFDESHRKRLIANARERLGPDMRVRIETVPKIARTRNGKMRAVICNV